MATNTAKKPKTSGTPKAHAASTHAATKRTPRPATAAAGAAELSTEVLKSVEKGQRAAIAAVRRFVDTVDEALPAVGDRPTRRQAVIDAALDMADKLVTTQYDFLRSVVRDAGHSLGPDGARHRYRGHRAPRAVRAARGPGPLPAPPPAPPPAGAVG